MWVHHVSSLTKPWFHQPPVAPLCHRCATVVPPGFPQRPGPVRRPRRESCDVLDPLRARAWSGAWRLGKKINKKIDLIVIIVTIEIIVTIIVIDNCHYANYDSYNNDSYNNIYNNRRNAIIVLIVVPIVAIVVIICCNRSSSVT